MKEALKKAVQGAAMWAVVVAGFALSWPPILQLAQLWMLVGVGIAANALQPAYRPFERSRTPEDRGTAIQILWTVYAVQIGALIEVILRRRAELPLDAVSIGAFVVMVAGLALRTWAVLLLGRFFTWNVSVQPGQTLVRSGPYRCVRHPSYTGALLTFLFGCVLLHSWIAAGVAAVALPIAFRRRIRHEEDLLLATLPEYAAYRTRTGALFPRLFAASAAIAADPDRREPDSREPD